MLMHASPCSAFILIAEFKGNKAFTPAVQKIATKTFNPVVDMVCDAASFAAADLRCAHSLCVYLCCMTVMQLTSVAEPISEFIIGVVSNPVTNAITALNTVCAVLPPHKCSK